MPSIDNATEWQRRILREISDLVGSRAIYTGPQDDHYKFTGDTIYGYIKLLGPKTRTYPPSGIKVIVEEKFWSQIRDDLKSGNDWYGKPSRHCVFEAEEAETAASAAALLVEAKQRSSRS